MNMGYKHTPYNYKFVNCSWTVIHVQYQKVHFFFKSTARENFLAMGLLCTGIVSTQMIDINKHVFLT